jgi:hypothetical protein
MTERVRCLASLATIFNLSDYRYSQRFHEMASEEEVARQILSVLTRHKVVSGGLLDAIISSTCGIPIFNEDE